MPELPEVESVRRQIDRAVVGSVVLRVHLHRPDIVEAPKAGSAALRKMLLEGERITLTARHGKQLAMIAESGAALRVHLGMTGTLTVINATSEKRPKPHEHAVWDLTSDGNHRRLVFRDPRRFGGLKPYASIEDLRATWAELGPDALTITGRQLASALEDRNRPIKAALLDQSLLAGVGNIYADEALHLSHIRPQRSCDSITQAECNTLARCIREVLGRAIKHGGSSIRDYRGLSGDNGSFQPHHRVYGRGGKPCPACGTVLTSTTIAQRTTVYCRKCQR